MTKQKPLVSCIIPTMNRPDMVERAVASAVGQSNARMEVIVVDDSTNKETAALLEKETAITFISNGARRGASFSRNVGIDAATGDVIAFLDDDDIWMPHKIETQVRYVEEYPLVGCRYTTHFGGRDYVIKGPVKISYHTLLELNYLGSCSFVMGKRESFKALRFDENRRMGEDWDLWLKILKAHGKADAIAPADYLVEYDRGDHERISNVDKGDREEYRQLLDSYRDDFSPSAEERFRARFLTPSSGTLPHLLKRRIAMEGGLLPATYRYLRRKIMKPLGVIYL